MKAAGLIALVGVRLQATFLPPDHESSGLGPSLESHL